MGFAGRRAAAAGLALRRGVNLSAPAPWPARAACVEEHSCAAAHLQHAPPRWFSSPHLRHTRVWQQHASRGDHPRAHAAQGRATTPGASWSTWSRRVVDVARHVSGGDDDVARSRSGSFASSSEASARTARHGHPPPARRWASSGAEKRATGGAPPPLPFRGTPVPFSATTEVESDGKGMREASSASSTNRPEDPSAVSESGGGEGRGGGGGRDDVWDVVGFLREHPHVLSVCLTTSLLMAGHSCVAPVLPMFASEFGATAAQVGMTLSAFAAARLVFNVPCGLIADRHGRRPLVIAGPVITAVGMFGSAYAACLPELFAWRFVAGAGSAVYMSGVQALLADLSTPSNRARVLGTNQAAVLAGAAVGPAIGGWMAGGMELGTRSPFVAVGAMCALAAAHAFCNVAETAESVVRRRGDRTRERETERERKGGGTGENENGGGWTTASDAAKGAGASASSTHGWISVEEAAANESDGRGDGDVRGRASASVGSAPDAEKTSETASSARSSRSEQMRVLFTSKDFWAVSGLNAALFFSGAGGRATLLPLLAVSDFGYSPSGLGAIFTAMAAMSLLGVGPAAALGDKYGRPAVIFPCVLGSSAAVATLGTTSDHNVFVASALGWAGAHSLMGPAPAAYATDVTPPAIRGTALSVYRTCGDVGLLTGPVLLGMLADHTSVGTALVANGAVLAGAAGVFRLTARDNLELLRLQQRQRRLGR